MIKKNFRNVHRSFALLCVAGFALMPLSAMEKISLTGSPSLDLFDVQANNETVKNVLNYIEKNSKYIFVYSEGVQDRLSDRVSVTLRNRPVLSVLKELCSKAKLDYRISGRQITISQKVERSKATPSLKNRKNGDNSKITGLVTDEKGEPLIGASVKIKGDNSGTITDLSGHFDLNAPTDAILVISYIGYDPKEVPVNAQKNLNIALSDNMKALDEVVVIGYGTQRKSDLTGGVFSIGQDKLEMVASNNLMDRLAGQIPGLAVTTSDAAPGADQTLRIRGENSLTADNSPLIVLDGIPYNGSLTDIDPNIVENISVLKDASASAIYGSRGANGIILIQTKKGKKGKPRVSYKGQFNLSQPQKRIDMMKGEEYIRLKQDIARLKDGWSGDQLLPENILSASELVNYKKGVENDWQDYIFRNAFTMDHQLAISGGTESSTYMASLSYLDQDGVVFNSNLKRANISLNITQVLNKWLTIGVSSQFIQKENGGITPNIEHAIKQSPYGIYKDDKGNYYEEPMDQSLMKNPMVNVNADQDKTNRNFFLNTFAEIQTPLKGLVLRTNFGYNYRNSFTGTYYGRNTMTGKNTNGKASISNENYWDYTWENLIKYNREFGKNTLDVTGLFSIQETQRKKSSESGESFVNDDSGYHNLGAAEKNKVISSNLSETAMLSYMLRLNYSYAGKYLLTLTGRSDGYSAFGRNNKYAFFPSVALAWNIASEKFMKNTINYLDQLKVRISYGSNGNQAISPYQTLDRLHISNYIWGDNGTIVNGAYLPNNGVGNPNLSWETTHTLNVGIDFSFFKGRVSGSIDTYFAKTKDLLMKRTVPIMNGYKTIMDNVGKTENKGVELNLNTINIITKNFKWSTGLNFTLNRDKIIDLRGDKKDDITNKWFIGKPLRVYYDYNVVGIWQEGDTYTYTANDGSEREIQPGAKPGSAKLEDVDGNGFINSKDKKIIGSKMPSFLMSMSNQFTYKNFYFSFLLNGTFKVTREFNEANISSWTFGIYNYLHGKSYWTPEHPDAQYASPAYTNFDGHSYYKDFTYVQLKNITLGYNISQNIVHKLGLSSISFNVSVNNAYTFCGVRSLLNYDNSWMASYPTTRSYVFGINLTF